MAAEPTAPKQRGKPFKAGQSGNPSGRPKGSRNKLSESFIAALYDDFEEHGVQAIQTMRVEKPGDYVKAIASLVPAQFQAVDKNGDATDLNLTVTFVRKDA
ncbi:hypothetical protein J2D73_19165 [Acetobacter sacchari]|uniref:DUF5681 domain-containing protein n=1 Tax=Acetobacter sacchari TaxID=2661687 RepID=A0ABS3M1D5_9PROT|nr:hypothetical protein [Acetobacter sacchari]